MDKEIIKEMTVILFGVCVIIIVAISIIAIPIFYASCRQAEIYNLKNNTEYTCSDFFWAVDQINSETKTISVIK